MKILVIGGTYFLGRVFTLSYKDKYDLTLVNRGQYDIDGVKQVHFDRHDQNGWKVFDGEEFDVVVDFCAYRQNDIKMVIDYFKNRIQHYLFISTVDVYLRQTGMIKDENHPLEHRHFSGDMGEYIYQKVLLESELKDCCLKYGIHYTSIRPGMIYGPFDYAPRESLLIQRVVHGLPLFHLKDADASFQMVYVKDVCDVIDLIIEKKIYDEAFNIVNDELINYDIINSILNDIKETPLEKHTIEEALALQYPLPFPILKEEEELYTGKKIENYGFIYTSIKKGLDKTYKAFYPVFKSC